MLHAVTFHNYLIVFTCWFLPTFKHWQTLTGRIDCFPGYRFQPSLNSREPCEYCLLCLLCFWSLFLCIILSSDYLPASLFCVPELLPVGFEFCTDILFLQYLRLYAVFLLYCWTSFEACFLSPSSDRFISPVVIIHPDWNSCLSPVLSCVFPVGHSNPY